MKLFAKKTPPISAEELKKKVSILDVFKHYQITLTKTGSSGEYKGHCPFHEDDKPSLSVNAEKGVYVCHSGTCGEKGDVISLVAKKENVDFKEALEILGRMWGESKVKSQEEEVKTISLSVGNLEVKTEKKVEEKPEIQGTLNLSRVSEYYHKKLQENPQAMEYLKKRGITNLEWYSRYGIGFADGSLLKAASPEQRKELKVLGIQREDSKEHLRNCVTFPLISDTGEVVGMYGRHIAASSNIKHVYLKGRHRGIFNRKASKVYPDKLILTESVIDALSLIQLGLENVQSVYGTNGLTEEHLLQLKEDRVKNIIIAFDNDEAGRSQAEKLKERLIKENFNVRLVFPPLCKDWNEELIKGLDELEAKRIFEEVFREEIPTESKKEQAIQVNDLTARYESTTGQWHFEMHGLKYRLTGVKEVFVTSLKVTVRAEHGSGSFVDSIDLCSYRSRSSFAVYLTKEFGVEALRVEKDLSSILEYLEMERERKLTPEHEKKVQMSEEERQLGLEFLKSPDIFQQIMDDMSALGYVGEDLNKQLAYLCATSRKLDDPFSLLIVSQSASGKSFLVDTVKKLIPREDVISITSLSDQALNYMEDLTHKFLVFGESVSHSEEVEYQIREMLSSKELTRQVTVKNEKTNEMYTKEVRKKTIVAMVMSTTSNKINPENATRFFIISVDESLEQTKRIHAMQRKKFTYEYHYKILEEIPNIIRKHQAAQRLLKKYRIINIFEEELQFPADSMRFRRDNERFLSLIFNICHLRQMQKSVKNDKKLGEVIECDIEDYKKAYELAHNGFLGSTVNELPHQSILLYEQIRSLAKQKAKEEKLEPEEVGFSQREVREASGLSHMFVKRYLRLLLDYEYVHGKVSARGTKSTYYLVSDKDLKQIDFSMIPVPEEMEKRLKSGSF